MRGRTRLVERIRPRLARDGRFARTFEPLASWLTVNRGLLRPTLRFVRHHGLCVGAGPFAGLRYPRAAILHVPGLATRLAGVYELELQPAIERMIAAAPPLVVNIGAGDGYYAAGFALRCPDANVVAYEADPYHAATCAETARANKVEARLDLRGTCTADDLAELDPPPGTAVICDAEGGEETLIDPARVPWLSGSPLVVEAHEKLAPGIAARLGARLSDTHDLELVSHGKRLVDDHPPIRDAPDLSAIEQEMLVSELRHWHTPWLCAWPKGPAAKVR